MDRYTRYTESVDNVTFHTDVPHDSIECADFTIEGTHMIEKFLLTTDELKTLSDYFEAVWNARLKSEKRHD